MFDGLHQWWNQETDAQKSTLCFGCAVASYYALWQHFDKLVFYEKLCLDKRNEIGNLLEYQNQIERAIQCYEAALQIESGATDVQQLLQRAKQKQRSAK